jgi:carbon starvation protein CstA
MKDKIFAAIYLAGILLWLLTVYLYRAGNTAVISIISLFSAAGLITGCIWSVWAALRLYREKKAQEDSRAFYYGLLVVLCLAIPIVGFFVLFYQKFITEGKGD